MDKKLKTFLKLVKNSAFGRRVPDVWAPQIRDAISSNYVTVGWGGRLKLTGAGESALSKDQ